jgi:hypothetical protein
LKPPRAALPRPPGRGQGAAHAPSRSFRSRQQGLSLIGLLLWAVAVGALAVAAVRVLPSINQYFAVRRAVERLAGTSLNPADIRADFNRQRATEPEISVLRGEDLDIVREGDQLVISFAYDKQIELMPPVYLLIKYHGRSR